MFLLMTPRYPLSRAAEIHLIRWPGNWGPLHRAKFPPTDLFPILIRIATVDGEFANSEKRVLGNLAQWLDVSAGELRSMITSTLDKHPVWTLDVQKAWSLIRQQKPAKPAGLLGKVVAEVTGTKRSYCSPGELTPERLRAIKKRLAIPEERTLLLVYDGTGEKAALTDRHLYLLPPKSERPPDLVPLHSIDDIQTGPKGCTVKANGKKTDLSAAARGFLEIVRKIRNDCLTRIADC